MTQKNASDGFKCPMKEQLGYLLLNTSLRKPYNSSLKRLRKQQQRNSFHEAWSKWKVKKMFSDETMNDNMEMFLSFFCMVAIYFTAYTLIKRNKKIKKC